MLGCRKLASLTTVTSHIIPPIFHSLSPVSLCTVVLEGGTLYLDWRGTNCEAVRTISTPVCIATLLSTVVA